MDPQFHRAKAIFLAAVEQHSPEDWQAFVEAACRGDAELQACVQELLKAHREIDGRPQSLEGAATILQSTIEDPAAEVGAYKLLEQIGEGGFGTVYMAEQRAPIRRRVALKVVKPGMDTRHVLARFKAERQALALMDHPNIARVFDAGETDSGRPYFVMELVRGVPITDYCDQNNLPVHERLELFVQVCHAVQHAHQKGIIHRDIKPSNVLVTVNDGRAVPKVIDFGVAKAINQQLTAETVFTRFTQMIGTPLYMSPEQADMTSLDVDTRGDIYSLGVLLYELLTGTTPFEKERFATATYEELLRIIREEDPPKPSTRLRKRNECLATVAAQRRTEPVKLSRMFRGDLDLITMKALAKDRTQRYETASALAADVQRYLRDEPVEACPPSTAYRLKKLARRHRAAIATASAFVALLIAAVIISTWLAIEANIAKQDAIRAQTDDRQQRTLAERERNRAMEAERKATANAAIAETHLQEATRQTVLAEQNFRQAKGAVDQYLTHVSEDPELAENPDLAPLRDKLLDSAVRFYQSFAAARTGDPALRAEQAAAHLRVSRIKHTLGKKNEWVPEFEKGLEIITTLLDKGATRQELVPLGIGLYTSRDQALLHSPTDPRAAVQVFQRAAKTWSTLASRHPDVAGFQNDLAGIYHVVAQLEFDEGHGLNAASAFFRAGKLLEDLVAKFPRDADYRVSLAVHLNAQGMYLQSSGQTAAAIKTLQRAIDFLEKVNEECPGRCYYKHWLCDAQKDLATVQLNSGHPEEAESTNRKSVAGFEELVSKYPRAVTFRVGLAYSSARLALALSQNGKRDEAIDQAQKKCLDQLGPIRQLVGNGNGNVRIVANAAFWIGDALSAAGRSREAIAPCEYSTDLMAQLAKEAPGNPRVERNYVISMSKLAQAQAFAERASEYASTCASLLERLRPDADLRALELAAPSLVLRAHAIKDYTSLVQTFAKHVKPDNATATLSKDEWLRCELLGMLLYRAGQYERSLERLNSWQAVRERTPAFQSQRPYGWFFLAMVHQRLGHTDQARKWMTQASEWTANAVRAARRAQSPTSNDSTLRWECRESLKLFRREAEDLIVVPRQRLTESRNISPK
jgi:serine/threonine protein kinase